MFEKVITVRQSHATKSDRRTRKSRDFMRTLHRYFHIKLYKVFLAHCDFCRLLITLVSSLNPNQDQHFVGSQFDTNKGADQTVARFNFCCLLITLANRSDPDQDQQCRPKQIDTDVNNKERGPDCANSLFHNQ